jgi:chromosomal replication initiation ATPase DnaA
MQIFCIPGHSRCPNGAGLHDSHNHRYEGIIHVTLHGKEMSYGNLDTKPVVLIRKKDRIDYILTGICRYYDTSMDDLMRRARTEKRFKRKRFAVKILRDIADCSLKDIMFAFNNKSEAAIWFIYDNITRDLDPYSVGDKRLKKEYLNLLEYLRL